MTPNPNLLLIGRLNNDSIGRHAIHYLECLKHSKSINVFVKPWHSHFSNTFNLEIIKKYEVREFENFNVYSDFLIFTDVLAHSIYENVNFGAKYGFIRFCQPVLEGTIAPKLWISIINREFDAVVVQSKSVRNALLNAGCEKAIFIIPNSLVNFKNYLAFEPKLKTESFTFGFIGSGDKRKNIFKVIKAFDQSFRSCSDVFLKIHIPYTLEAEFSLDKIIQISKDNPRIHISYGRISDEELEFLFKSIDAYVYPSLGEGYSFSAREALVLGLPLIISDNSAHKDIIEVAQESHDLILEKIDSSIPTLAEMPGISNLPCGALYDCLVEDISKAMLKVYKNREKYLSKEAIQARKKISQLWSSESVSKTILTLFDSKSKVVLSNKNEVDPINKCIFTTDKEIKNKYDILKDKKKREFLQKKKTILIANDSGFFSFFNEFVVNLMAKKTSDILIPDFRKKSVIKHMTNWKKSNNLNFSGDLKDTELSGFCYASEEDGNLWLKLFEPLPYLKGAEVYNSSMLNSNAEILPRWSFIYDGIPFITDARAFNFYKSKDFNIWRNKFHEVFKKNIKVRPEILMEAEDFFEKNLSDKFVISIHHRHHSHKSENPYFKKHPDGAMLIKNVHEVVRKYKLSKKNYSIFLATDNDKCIEDLRKEFGARVVCTNSKRITIEKDKEYRQKLQKDKLNFIYHHGIHDLLAKDSEFTWLNAKQVLVDALILAKGNVLLHAVSNIATAVSYINPKIDMIFFKEF